MTSVPVLLIVLLLYCCFSNNIFITLASSKSITFRVDRTITRSVVKPVDITTNTMITTASNFIDFTDDSEISERSIITDSRVAIPREKADSSHHDNDSFRDWFRHKDIPLVILHSNPGILSVEQLDDQRYKAHIAPLQFPGKTLAIDKVTISHCE